MNKKYINLIFWLIIIFAFVFSWSYNFSCLGDEILNYFGLPAWSVNNSSGSHYTVIYSAVMVLIAIIIRVKYSNLNLRKASFPIVLIIFLILILTIYR